MSQSNSNSGVWLIVLIVVGVAMFLNALGGGGSSSSSTTTSAPSVDRGSFEHRYATERLKQEGYSSSEAQQAADAIIKFHNAQKNR